ncbi:hypothetical protein [Rhizobium flavescens]|uniref:hypothetical protein n=1 Tax=Rhizobium flavescens TaxID=2607407 RepID=UPI00140B9376|nr:hypothetical protein [Rhizobium flavescens]
MAKPSKRETATKAAYIGSLGASLDEIGFKSRGTRIKVRPGVDSVGGLSASCPGDWTIFASETQNFWTII